MTDDELRTLVREAIARHLSGHDVQQGASEPRRAVPGDPAWRAHPSFGKFLALQNDEAGACIIEPTVQCNSCGFCKSYGH